MDSQGVVRHKIKEPHLFHAVFTIFKLIISTFFRPSKEKQAHSKRMSWNQSDLSSPRYGYDFVVATTQSSINATLKLFLSNLEEPVVNYCFVTNDNNEQTYIEWDKLMVLTDNLDPFTVPNGLDSTDSRVQKLFSARFTGGFRAQLGLPGGNYTDDIVILGGEYSAHNRIASAAKTG